MQSPKCINEPRLSLQQQQPCCVCTVCTRSRPAMADLAYVMSQSLSPTKIDSSNPISPSKYPDKRSMVNAYKRMVQIVLDSPEDRNQLQKILKEFHRTLVVEDLMEKLKSILNAPNRRKLYLAIRPLVPSRLRGEYNSLIPHIPSYEKKVIHLKQNGSRSLGFNIRGGKEFRCGVFVSSVLASSKSHQAGLKVGDEIVRINGLILSESTHEEVVNIIRNKKSLTLTVKCVGMIPEQDVVGNMSWKEVEERKPRGPANPMRKLNSAILRSTKKIQVTVAEGESLGVSIKTTSDKTTGIFISEVVPNSIAYETGLKIGDEMVEVNGHSLINVPHREAVQLLKSSNTLMLTIRNKDPTVNQLQQQGYDPLSNPPEDFEMNPQDIDMDAELIPTDLNASYGFMLRSKDGVANGNQQQQQRGLSGGHAPFQHKKRLSLTDMDTERNTNAPIIASPAAYGFGPSVAMPAILGMMPEMPTSEEGTDGEGEGQEGGASLMKYLEEAKSHFTPQQMAAVRESMAFPDLTRLGGEVRLDASFFASPQAKQDAGKMPSQQQPQTMPPQAPPTPKGPPTAPKPKQSPGGVDYSSYQFPVEDEETSAESAAAVSASAGQQRMSSAFKKEGVAKKKTPAFRENVEIINDRGSLSSNSAENMDSVHPSNMEFSEKVLQGRMVKFHTVPKDGPIKIAIRGGTDTPLGGAIIISRILEGGAADRYGRLNVGDQILLCDGVNFINVTHNEAALALKKAMDMDSRSIDLVVAVNPDASPVDDTKPPTPQTMWPPREESDTICDAHPSAIMKGHDYAKSSHRAHSGFTLRGEKSTGGPHSFLPQN